jgi:hypothetical protein
MQLAKRYLGGVLTALVLVFVLAWLNAPKAEAGVYVANPMSPAEKAYKEWCSHLSNFQYLMNPGCWQYF